MPPSKRRSRKPAGKNNNFLVFLAIIIVLAIISMVAAYFINGDESRPTTTSDDIQVIKKTDNRITPIEGTWVSNYDGTMLTIEGLTVVFESPSVDESSKISSNISVEENIVTFIDESGACKNIEGHYLYSLDENGELFFKLIKDKCPKRQELMTMSWFKI